MRCKVTYEVDYGQQRATATYSGSVPKVFTVTSPTLRLQARYPPGVPWKMAYIRSSIGTERSEIGLKKKRKKREREIGDQIK